MHKTILCSSFIITAVYNILDSDKQNLYHSCLHLMSSPALLISMSSLFSFRRKLLQNSLTECRFARSSSMWETLRLWLLNLISLTAFAPLSTSLQAMMTRAPLIAKAMAVSLPMPEFPPTKKKCSVNSFLCSCKAYEYNKTSMMHTIVTF